MKYDADALQRDAVEYRRAMVGSTYRHHKGNTYTVLAVVIDEETGDPVVVYTDEDVRMWWSRRLSNFMGQIGGEPRFRLVRRAR